MPKNPYRPYTPKSEFMDLLNGYNGKFVNGWDEKNIRQPTMVWWTPDMDDAIFGKAQQWFYMQEQPDEEMITLRAQRKDVVESPLPPVSEQVLERSSEQWTSELSNFVEAGYCEMTGVTQLRQEWVFDHEQVDLQTIIMLGVQHDYEELRHVPELRGGKDVTRQYVRAALVAKKVASWLREQGWQAEAVTGPMTGKVLMIPHAIECGFGELGKHGSIINPEFGSAFRLAAVLTNAPFATTSPRDFGIEDFCRRCKVCENVCPPEAISSEKHIVRGINKWAVDFDRCIPFFADHSGCAICIAACPWSRPGIGEKLVEKLARRAKRLKARGTK